MKYLIVLILALFALSSVNASNSIECEVCEYAANYADLLIKSNATETEIINKVEGLCKFIPSGLQATCDSLISNYGEQLIQMIINKESPSTLCSQIGLCSSSSSSEKAVEGILECDICKYIVTQVTKYISGNATEAQILKFLDKDCDIFGKGGSVTCQNIVNNYAPQIINLILNNESPSEVCGLVGLCASKIEEPVQGELECGVCEVIAQQCQNYVKANKTESEIVGLLDQFCSSLSIFESACDTIVASSAPKIINLLLQNQSPSVVCTEIGFCGNSSSGNNQSSQESSSSSQPSSSSESSESSYSGSMTGASSGSGSGSGTSGNMRIYIQ
ncbi:hypothetical protein ACTFIV_004904 [Dictyostelium citrinum]